MNQTFQNSIVDFQEDLVQCPYDPVHMLRKERLRNHLFKCRAAIMKQPTSPYYERAKNMSVCRYNGTHHIPSDQQLQHEKTCPQSIEALKQKFQPVENKELFPGISKMDESKNIQDSDEEWSDNEETYDPLKKVAADSQSMHLPQGLTKSQRRDHRFAKRQPGGLQENYFDDSTWTPPAAVVAIQPKPLRKPQEVKQQEEAQHVWAEAEVTGEELLPGIGIGRGKLPNVSKDSASAASLAAQLNKMTMDSDQWMVQGRAKGRGRGRGRGKATTTS